MTRTATIRMVQAAGRQRVSVSESLDARKNGDALLLPLREKSLCVVPGVFESPISGASNTTNCDRLRAEANPDRRKGRSMSRRSGQDGSVERKGNYFYVRFWMDEGSKRVHKSVRLCPVSGLGSLTKAERKRRARQIVADSGADSPGCLARAEASRFGVMLREQAEWWIEHIRVRKRKPVKLSTLFGYRHLLDRWILSRLGNLPLCDVNNPTVKSLVADMVQLDKSPETIRHAVKVVKLVVASYLDANGEPVFRPKWNADYMDMPVVEKRNQRRPVFTGEEVTRIVSRAEGRSRVLFAVAAGTGARISELLALEIGKHVSADCSAITIEQTVWRHGEVEGRGKSTSAHRDVDLCSDLAPLLREFIAVRESGFLFSTENGRPLSQRNALRDLHSVENAEGLEKRGLHAFRRFRQTWLRKNRAPEDLIRYWLGWSNGHVSDSYSRLQDDLNFRKTVAESLGLGFELPLPEPASVPICTLRESMSEVA
ncbi:MAG: site-specific integrase [Candidatus Acidiferrales bacterium]